MLLYRHSYHLLPAPVTVAGSLHYGNIKLAVDFNINIPGWLPPTHMSNRTATRYGLVATANVAWAPDCIDLIASHSIQLRRYWEQMRRRTKSMYTPVHIRRHSLPSAVTSAAENPYSFKSFHLTGVDVDIESKEWYDIDSAEGVAIRLDLRKTCRADMRYRLAQPPRLLALGMHIHEKSTFRSSPSRTFTAAFPLPDLQPSRQDQYLAPPLTEGISTNPTPARKSVPRECSLGPNGQPLIHAFVEDLPLSHRWRSISATLWPGNNYERPQSELLGPFISISHFLKIRLVFLIDGEVKDAEIDLPIRLGTTPRSTAAPPPYVSMFHENGDERECELPPLYSDIPKEMPYKYEEVAAVEPNEQASPSRRSLPVPKLEVPRGTATPRLTARPLNMVAVRARDMPWAS